MNIRVGKKDRTFVYVPALGCNITRDKVYFEVTYQMTIMDGTIKPVVEVLIDDRVACSSYIELQIERNPHSRNRHGVLFRWTITCRLR